MARYRRRHGLAAALALAAALFFGWVYQNGRSFDGNVLRVLDGDTIELMHEGKPARIRIWGVDCPEKGQPYGAKARAFTAGICRGQVSVQVKDKDRYGRLVARIRLQDGTDLGEQLVGAGYAWHYRAYAHDATLARLEAQARGAHAGLWAQKNPDPPWEFRQKMRVAVEDKIQ